MAKVGPFTTSKTITSAAETKTTSSSPTTPSTTTKRGGKEGAVWLYILGRGQFANNTLEANRTTAGFNNVGQGGAMRYHLGVTPTFT